MKEKKQAKPQQKTPEKAELQSAQELTEDLKRLQADFQNYRKQQEKRIEDIRKTATKHLLLDLLPVLDHLNLALKHSSNPEEFKQGVEMINQQLIMALQKQGLEPMKAQDQAFDMTQHEAIEKIESDQPKDHVVEVVQTGYTLGDKVLRPAKVKISAGQDKNENKNEKEETS